MPHKYLLKEFEELASSAADPDTMMQRVSQRIHEHIPRYNWVGFYLVDKKDPSALVLGPTPAALLQRPKFHGMKVYAAQPLQADVLLWPTMLPKTRAIFKPLTW